MQVCTTGFDARIFVRDDLADPFLIDAEAASPAQLQLPLKNVLRSITNIDETIPQIQQWRLECQSHHSACVPALSDAYLPSRLVDVANPEVIKLVDTKGKKGRYFCLSHCWGTEGMPIRTTRETIHSIRSGVAVASLPATFRDAVEVTRKLGCQYLWIDSLCIIQDDSHD